jgi:hypothetical protein
MSTTRFILGLFGGACAVAGVRSGLSNLQVANSTQTGVITNTGERGIFVKTTEMSIQRGQYSTSHVENDMNFSLYGDKDLIEKAKKYNESATLVNITYDQYFSTPLFAAESPRKVKEIKPVEIKPVELNSSFRK